MQKLTAGLLYEKRKCLRRHQEITRYGNTGCQDFKRGGEGGIQN